MRFLYALLLASACSGNTIDVITNGGFETGTLAGWSATSLANSGCGQDWHVIGNSFTGCQTVDAPVLGSFEAANTFDGPGPLTYRLSETFSVPTGIINSAFLTWSDTFNVAILSTAQSREFFVDLSADVTQKMYSKVILPNCGTITCTPEVQHWTTHSIDVTSFLSTRQGQNVTVGFNNKVPETFTGAGGFGLDGVSLTIDYTSVPEPTSFLLVAAPVLLLFRRRISGSLQ